MTMQHRDGICAHPATNELFGGGVNRQQLVLEGGTQETAGFHPDQAGCSLTHTPHGYKMRS